MRLFDSLCKVIWTNQSLLVRNPNHYTKTTKSWMLSLILQEKNQHDINPKLPTERSDNLSTAYTDLQLRPSVFSRFSNHLHLRPAGIEARLFRTLEWMLASSIDMGMAL
ncbi:hypothetical protein AWENTII_007769 [Aspergillus wentii]